MKDERAQRGAAYSSALERAFRPAPQLKVARALLAEPRVSAEAAELDSQLGRQRHFVAAVDRALENLGPVGPLALGAAAQRPAISVPPQPPKDGVVDLLARWLLAALPRWPEGAIELAVATGRLFEESAVLTPEVRRTMPLGAGFEGPLEERLRLRFGLIGQRPELLASVDDHLRLLLEAPDDGLLAVRADVGGELSGDERRWIDAERFAGMLAIARSNKQKTSGGQIRWFLRSDPAHGPVLDRYGAHGHWLVTGRAEPGTLARAGALAARATDEDRPAEPGAWRALAVGDSTAAATAPPASVPIEEAHALPGEPLDLDSLSIGGVGRGLRTLGPDEARRRIAASARRDAPPRPADRRYLLTADDRELKLLSTEDPGDERTLARVELEPDDDDAMLEFIGALGRVADAGEVADRVPASQRDSSAARWARALLGRRPAPRPGTAADDLTGLNVRLVYVPASLPHPLGGLPLIGLRYLADRLERLGARADVLTIQADDLERRLDELLGADVIGLSVYLTNDSEAAQLVELLRAAGFAGRIVLGGPQMREIDLIQRKVKGWDALIRGEGEEAFPRVLRVLRHLDAGDLDRGLELARSLRGVAIAHGDLVVLADTAARNATARISCPLPFEWQRHSDAGVLKMNFTRGCPYQCGFCPNHQGQRYHSCGSTEMWTFTERAAADALTLPREEEERRATAIQAALGVEGPPRLRLALDLLLRDAVPRALLEEICPANLPDLEADRVPAWKAKERWLEDKATLLSGATIDREGTEESDSEARLRPFEIMTSEDNTLVNRKDVIEYMDRRRVGGLADAVTFNPGQNTVRDLTDHHGEIDLDYVEAICAENPFKVVLGVDGTSNPVLRQNHKPYYSLAEAVALNRELNRRGIEVFNNYILLTPETNLLEAIEAFALFVLLPIRWRDHGDSINLRIIKEPGTRSHDEGLLFAPDDEKHVDPIRFAEVEELLRDRELTSEVPGRDLPALLWRLLAEDPRAQRLLPKVVRRWELDFDDDPFLRTLAARIRRAERPGVPLVDTLRQVAAAYEDAWPAEPDDGLDDAPAPSIEPPGATPSRPRRAPRPVPAEPAPAAERQAEKSGEPATDRT